VSLGEVVVRHSEGLADEVPRPQVAFEFLTPRNAERDDPMDLPVMAGMKARFLTRGKHRSRVLSMTERHSTLLDALALVGKLQILLSQLITSARRRASS
jgi:hypothetical protein